MTRILTVFVVVLLTSIVWAVTSVELSGSQVRGTPGHNAELICAGLTLPRAGTIASVECSGQGFWINGPRGFNRSFYNPTTAIGTTLPAGGPYRVFPNLKVNQDRAAVTLRINY